MYSRVRLPHPTHIAVTAAVHLLCAAGNGLRSFGTRTAPRANGTNVKNTNIHQTHTHTDRMEKAKTIRRILRPGARVRFKLCAPPASVRCGPSRPGRCQTRSRRQGVV